MISMQELNPHSYPTSDEIEENLEDLLDKINEVRTAYGIPMVVTSGLRSQADQQRINPGKPKSRHLTGQAVDILDADGSFWAWLMKNMSLLKKLDLYLEDKVSTPTWVHLQTMPPASKNRIFKP